MDLTHPYAAPTVRYLKESQLVIDFIGYLLATAGIRPEETNAPVPGLEKYLPLICEMTFQRNVDNFLTSISDILTIVFTVRPEMLTSEEKLTYKEVLEYETKQELIAALAERKVMDLSFKGLKELAEYLSAKHGFVLFEQAADLERAAILVEKRNLLAHNRGYVNKRYLTRVKGAKEKLGERLNIDARHVFDEQLFLARSNGEMQKGALQRFLLPVTPVA